MLRNPLLISAEIVIIFQLQAAFYAPVYKSKLIIINTLRLSVIQNTANPRTFYALIKLLLSASTQHNNRDMGQATHNKKINNLN
ncbi:MAG: hypothetical protein OXC48_02415 [Endozoicomonadaceae bacterium]|nr:hypothetical protein [Endozoicomonadaceae bacterium]